MSLQRQEKLLKQIEREENDLAKMVGSGQYFLFFVFFFCGRQMLMKYGNLFRLKARTHSANLSQGIWMQLGTRKKGCQIKCV